MIRPLSERVPIPSPTIQLLAERLEGEARRLATLDRGADDIDLSRLWRRLATWSATVKHIAWSGPASHDVALRAFEEHPDHARAGEDAIVQFEALADVIGFLAVGDMVLAAMASTFLGRWGGSYADDNPWPGFMAAIDERAAHAADDQRLTGPARELDLDLREARHRIAAHRRRAHAEILSWDFDDALTIEVTNPGLRRLDPELLRELGFDDEAVAMERDRESVNAVVIEILEAADRRLEDAVATHPGRRLPARRERVRNGAAPDVPDLFERLHGHARWLDGEGRRLVRSAHKIAGYETVSPVRVVGATLRMTAEIEAACEP